MMYLRYTLYLLVWLQCAALGLIGGYHLARYVKGFGWLSAIYGNDVDGWSGDANYKDNQARVWYRKPWPDYWWSTIRNPVHNLLLNHFSASGILTEWRKKGKYTTVATIGGKRYFFIHLPVKWKNDPMKFGWKLWDDKMAAGL